MASTTRFSANVLNAVVALLLWLAAGTVLGEGSGIRAQSAGASYGNSRIELSARFAVSLNPTLENALANGVSLPFVYEFQLTRPRGYALYRQVADWFSPTAELGYRLSYHAISRQYRLHLGSFYRSFASLDDALSALGVVRDWGVLAGSAIADDKSDFAGRVRLRLDLSQMPKPFQLSTLGQGDWKLESPWVDIAPGRDEARE
ncbi:DUF4390 domain-containing protein [Jeongeupia sp. USM3]|uniref:DUF4390 domain-containing protein n=1 Tax=Jeongeupia sp. USM3 TaxID=1906741 RepID=UPI00089DE688|nr:DUF4390 domain-containing protein [Jeongeupia sp. USM3]AOY00548.1 hypothetical protein BJP62_08900 [Jeongeupia sp. USM3]